MDFSVCPYCNQSYSNGQSHNCKQNVSFQYERREINNKFENPLQRQNNVKESSSLSIELRNQEVNLYKNIDDLNSGLLRDTEILQDQAAFHTNTDNVNEETSYKLPSFQSSFSNSRYQNVNLEISLELPNHILEISNRKSSIPYTFHQADNSFAHNKNQTNLGIMENCCELTNTSGNVEFALKNSLDSKQEELPKNWSFTVQQQKVIENGYTTCISTLKDESVNFSYEYGELESHGSSKMNKHICLDCAIELGIKAILKEHSENLSNFKMLICDVCQKYFLSRITVNKNNRTKDEVFSIGGPSYSQPFIGDITKTGSLKIQKSADSIASTLKDPLIPKSADIPCPGVSCNPLLKLRSTIRSKKAPFNCEICQRCFTRNYRLKRHLLTHTNEKDPKKKSFICEICQKGFTRKEHLERHLLTHTKEQDPKKRPFICEICQRGFIRIDHLKKHLLTHTKE